MRVILTAGVLENFDEEQSKRVQADGDAQEAVRGDALLAAVKPLAEAATAAREAGRPAAQREERRGGAAAVVALRRGGGFRAGARRGDAGARRRDGIDGRGNHRAASLTALQTKPARRPPVLSPSRLEPEAAIRRRNAAPGAPIMETVRRVNTLRNRSHVDPRAGYPVRRPRPPNRPASE